VDEIEGHLRGFPVPEAAVKGLQTLNRQQSGRERAAKSEAGSVSFCTFGVTNSRAGHVQTVYQRKSEKPVNAKKLRGNLSEGEWEILETGGKTKAPLSL